LPTGDQPSTQIPAGKLGYVENLQEFHRFKAFFEKKVLLIVIPPESGSQAGCVGCRSCSIATLAQASLYIQSATRFD
jgi:hypothetical protein